MLCSESSDLQGKVENTINEMVLWGFIQPINNLSDTNPLGCGLDTDWKCDQAFFPFTWLVVGDWFAAPNTHRAEEHRGFLIVTVHCSPINIGYPLL